MSRFIILEDRMINVDHIVEVVDHDDGVVTICLTNSEMIPASSEVCDKILGCDHAVSVIPCGPNLWARMTYPNGKTFRIAVDNLILKADGTYYPLEAELLEDSSEGALRFVELFSNDGEDETSNRGDENTRPYFRRLGSTRDENQNWEANSMKKKKMSDMTPRQLRCPHCGAVAIIRPASEIYDDPRRKDELYVCKNYPACKSYVGMHAGTRIPLGTLANGDLRNLRIKAHRRFDRIWQSGIMSRNAAYRWMADSFGLAADDAHIGKFGEYRCQQLIEQCDRILARNQKAAS